MQAGKNTKGVYATEHKPTPCFQTIFFLVCRAHFKHPKLSSLALTKSSKVALMINLILIYVSLELD